MLKTGINFNNFGYDYSDRDIMRCIRDAGFDSFFTGSLDREQTEFFRENAEKLGLVYESVHAPFHGINCMWKEGEKGDEYVKRLCEVADICRLFDIGYFTLHCMNVPQFNNVNEGVAQWSEIGFERFRRVLYHAGECGVKACFENVEFPQFEMKRLIDAFRAENHGALGFTWDVGHEHCYPAPCFDVMDCFGDLIVGTHIHDNFAQSDKDLITWNDDTHILPFDGTIDFRKVAKKLKSRGYNGTLTLETFRKTDVLPWYRDITIEKYLAMAHERAERIAALIEEDI